MSVTVTTQAELDKALADKVGVIYISSPAGVRLQVSNTGSSHVVARGSSHVVARGSSHVEARGSSHVVAWESSHVVAWESSHVVAWESSHVEAWGSSHVEAWESSHVVAWESSHVEARGSSHVEAWESSHVVAWESSHVVARESSHVEASRFTAVHLWSQRVILDSSGAVVDLTSVDLDDPQQFIEYHGVKVTRGKALVFKAVDDDLMAGHSYIPTSYAIGKTVTAPDWQANQNCGYGLHFSPSPAMAKSYNKSATRFLAVEVKVAGLIALNDKVKARAAKVLYEVDIYGERVDAK